MTIRQKSDFIGGVALLLLSGLVFVLSFELDPNSRVFPMVISLALGAASLIGVVKGALVVKKGKPRLEVAETPPASRLSIRATLVPLIVSGFCLLFILTFQRIGFEISAICLVFFIMLMMNRREALRQIHVAIAIPMLLLLIFVLGLNLRIPLLLKELFK